GSEAARQRAGEQHCTAADCALRGRLKLRLRFRVGPGAEDTRAAMDRLELAIGHMPDAPEPVAETVTATEEVDAEPAPPALDKTGGTVERLDLALERLARAIGPKQPAPPLPVPELTAKAQGALADLERAAETREDVAADVPEAEPQALPAKPV